MTYNYQTKINFFSLPKILRELFLMYYIFIGKPYTMRKDVMITLRITPVQYVALLETLVREKKTKSEFLRESIQNFIEKVDVKNCRKRDITSWLDSH